MERDIQITYLEEGPETVSVLARWYYEEWGRNVPGRTLDTAREKVMQSAGNKEIPLTLVCFREGKPVGTAGIDTADMKTHPELSPWMVSVYVEPEHRGKGLGTALCERVKEEFKRLGVDKAYLFTFDRESLYTRLGWKTILREEYRGEPVAIMRLDL